MLDRRHGGDKEAMARENAALGARARKLNTRWPVEGERIEFLSDGLTDKGPATGTIIGIKTTVDGNYLTVKFSDSQESFSWDDLDEAGADVRGGLWLVKSHVKGHVKSDGTYVKPHERGPVAHLPAYPHPKLNDAGKSVEVKRPHHASDRATWNDADAVATFLPDGDVPASLNGVPFRRWRDHPTTPEGWDYVDGVNEYLVEPAFPDTGKKYASAGVIIEELDGRIWLCAPTNAFGGYNATFPKGSAEPGLSLQANAVKEAFEETGLQVRITGFLGDFERTTSVARMYRAVRVGGTPVEMGWESQAVHLCPQSRLYDLLNRWADHPVAEMLGAGPAPVPPAKNLDKGLF